MKDPSSKQVNFASLDGLAITADYYKSNNAKGLILLCHRSHCNRGEYRETAPKFVEMGYSCLAIDQRSGMNIFSTINETSTLAKKKKLPTGYLDAKQDIEAAINFAYEINDNSPIILLGSSYSASLSLLIALKNDKVAKLVLFSPNECLKDINIQGSIDGLSLQTYATSSKSEITDTEKLLSRMDAKYVTQFKPDAKGFHGSKILWESVPGHEAIWESLQEFLSKK